MPSISEITDKEAALSVRNKLNSAIAEANKVDSKLNADNYTATDVKAKYEENENTNTFTDAEKQKLGGLDSSNYATAEQGQKADSALQSLPANNVTGEGVTVIAAVTEYPATEDPETLYVLVPA